MHIEYRMHIYIYRNNTYNTYIIYYYLLSIIYRYYMCIYSKKIPTDPWNMPQVLPQNTTAFLYTQVVEGLGYIPEQCWSFLEYMQCTIVACYYFALLVPNFFDVHWFQTPLETSFRR